MAMPTGGLVGRGPRWACGRRARGRAGGPAPGGSGRPAGLAPPPVVVVVGMSAAFILLGTRPHSTHTKLESALAGGAGSEVGTRRLPAYHVSCRI